MDKKEELTQIVKKVQKDIGQFELLYSHIISKVYYWCYTVVKDEAIAKDLAQESLIRIYQKINTLDTPEAFHSWMYILVRNICYRYVNSHRNSDTTFLESDEYSEYFENTIEDERTENLPNESYNLKETRELIVGFIQNLPVKQREVIMMFYLEEFTINEIMEILNCKNGTVKSHLHSGRKNLEKQINDYQVKNNIKLYSSVTLPLLGAILQSHEEELTSKTELNYDKNIFKLNKLLNSSKLVSVISSNVAVAVSVVVITSIIVISVVFMKMNNNNIEIENNELLANKLEMLKKINGNPYIDSITYSTFPTRESTSVIVNLKKDITDQEIKISLDDKEIPFERENRKINMELTENGKYIISINDNELTYIVSVIDNYAPELKSIQNYGNYLKLNVNDEMSYIDYKMSYIEYKGQQFHIDRDLKVWGEFKGEIEVFIYINEKSYNKYFIEI
ncbi:RNA polymerase sigma factor [Breznakia pachnodae]|uniref:RNA polymerase sigma factor (Sigma-70 family) n=1 Tax=Breznakia pachnodae TaxID=265178 RepID=A0ABU0E0Q4_9FIRM|nr:RNA polymerase sigma factor [Breznakia pachnodae]MDQ0360466.1 RNA polymerase sigma factor (sigma-70 family) [Breznakia pachnodae]